MMHGFIPPKRYFAYLSWTDIDQLSDKANVVIIQPVGAIEQHGPHLPLAVDAAIALGVLGEALGRLEPEIPAYALPPLYYGKSNEHCHFPGTITLSATTLLAVLMEVGASLYRAGFRKLLLLNAHGGQPEVMNIAARDLHEKWGDLLVFPLFVWRVPHNAPTLLSQQELIHGIHAGDAETSLLLALLPEQVKLERAVREYPQNLPESLLSLEGKLPFAWLTHELTRSGVIGDATAATPEKGEKLLDSLADGWVRAIKDVYHFRQPTV